MLRRLPGGMYTIDFIIPIPLKTTKAAKLAAFVCRLAGDGIVYTMKTDGSLHGFTASFPGLPGFLPSGNLGLPAKDKGLLEESNPFQETNCIHDHYTCQVLVAPYEV